MNIDFIKWLVGYAEEFKCVDNSDGSFNGIHYRHIYSMDNVPESALYPLLLQRAIEGINASESPFFIAQNSDFVIAYEYGGKNYNHFSIMDLGVDQAKEEALEYVWEQEK